MPKYKYIFFGDEIYKEAEVKWNQMRRREQYLKERDYHKRIVLFGEEKDLIKNGFTQDQLIDTDELIPDLLERKEKSEKLNSVLDKLKETDSLGYEIIYKYYLESPALNLNQIAGEYNLTRQAVTYRLKTALKKLKKLLQTDEF